MRDRRRISPTSFQLKIDKIVYGGSGLGRHGGKVVFVPLTAPGDRVRVRVVEQKKNLIRASLVKVLEPGPGRQAPPCPHFGRCGGCQWQHLEYSHQLEVKRQILVELFHHRLPATRKMEITMIGSPESFGYRSRARVQLRGFGDRTKIGFFQLHSHRVEDVGSCPLLHPVLNEALASIREARRCEASDSGVQQMDLACSPEDGTWCSDSVNSSPNTEVSTPPAVETSRSERPILRRSIGEFTYWVSPSAFFQANDYLLGQLVETIRTLSRGAGSRSVLDLFSGVGLFTLPLARQFRKVVAVESSPLASWLCAKNAGDAGMQNIQIICAEASAWMQAFISPPAFDLVVLDPPRTGAPPEVLEHLVDWVPETILYVSCDPHTLLRDLAVLSPRYYRIDFVQGHDFFPQTYHFETIVRLKRV